MIAKELRDARWVTTAGLMLVVVLALQVLHPDLQHVTLADVLNQADSAMSPATLQRISLATAYVWAAIFANALWFIAGFAGAAFGSRLVASELASGTILLLLSRPLSRTRILLTKYAVAAGLLLALCILCGVLTAFFDVLYGLPQPAIGGLIASVLLLWLAALFICGLTLIWSVLTPSALACGFLGFFTAYAIVLGPVIYTRTVYGTGNSPLSLATYWGNLDIYAGVASPLPSLLISLAAALVPPLVALFIFRRRSF